MEHAEAVFAATKGLNDEEGGFSVEGLDDSKVKPDGNKPDTAPPN